MRIHQIIFLGFIAVAFVVGCIKAPRKVIGGVIGGFVGVLIPFSLSAFYVWRGGDPTAAGAFSFFCLFTLPLGIGIGVVVASRMGKSDKDKV
jgi:hypothetical protein